MKLQSTFLFNLILVLFLMPNIDVSAQCKEPLNLDWLQPYLGSTCTDQVYAFSYNNEDYIYAASTPSCIAADARNTLYNCNTGEFCYIFGFTPPNEQCDAELQQTLSSFTIDENVIYPTNPVIRTCNDPLRAEWLSPLLQLNCTDGVYAFNHQGTDFVYRSTACENVDDPNYLYNCGTEEICYVQGRTFPELQCDLTEFPLTEYLIIDNLIWSTPLLDLGKDFPWLLEKLNVKNCTDNVVSRFDSPAITFVAISQNNNDVLYNAEGDLYCTDRSNLDCLSTYNLNEPTTQWTCNLREPENIACEAIDADDLPIWLSDYISNLGCECGGEILQYCYNDVTYISYEASASFCADYAGFVFSEDGTQICQNGGITGGDCYTILPNFFDEATLVNDLWACEDCSQLAFETAELGCSSCCDDVIYYTVTGTSTNYTVTYTYNGVEVLNGDPVGAIGPNNNIELLVTTGAGCTATTSIPFNPFCCEVPPMCNVNNVFYSCEEGLQIDAYPLYGGSINDCNESAIFRDQYGNTHQVGDIINDDSYELTIASGGNTISPPCGTFELTVQCESDDPCQLDAGEIVSDPELCGLGMVYLEAEYQNPSAADDNEYVFVQVNNDDSFEVLTEPMAYRTDACYYGIHYRYSCDVPNFNAPNFSEILDAEANYAITNCYLINYISPPEYYISTPSYCNGEGLFTVGVTVTGGTGSYIIGEDYTGQPFNGEEGENFITFVSGLEDYNIYPIDAETGCSTDYIITPEDPGCGTFAGICQLPADAGPCEALIPRFYYNSEEGDCLQFNYGGCEGNANNFETYSVCIESCGLPAADCLPGQAIDWPWIQNMISNSNGCNVYNIDQFEYKGNTYCRTSPYTDGYPCPSDLSYFYYDCKGNQVCRNGFSSPNDPELCDIEIIKAANDNPIHIWTYRFDSCDDPFETEIVQNAIDNNCTGSIYAFNYQNEDYIYISTLCEYIDATNTLYNCNTDKYCNIGGFAFPNEACNNTYSQVQSLINDENIIWSRPCNYEYTGTVNDDPQNGCGYVINLTDGTSIEPLAIQSGFTLAVGQRVQLSYNILQPSYGCSADYYVNIICIREIEEEQQDCDNTVAPIDYLWVQNLINNWPLCSLYSIDQFEYNGNTYFRTSPYGSYPCASDYFVYFYDCEGNEVCVLANLPLDDLRNCDSEITDAAKDNFTNIWTKNIEEEDCACDADYTPVCGTDGNTYGNACQAACEGVEIDYDGACTEPCICPAVFEPVCGTDGNTYGNACEAACEGVEIDYDGACAEPCICPAVFEPVCGTDGNTYGNACEAACEGVEIDYDGACAEPCICPAVFEPVCGTDGNTYGNACEAACEGVEIDYDGACAEPCICPAVFEPVCGTDGNTYGNACEAACEGVEIDYDGACAEPCICPAVFEPVCGTDGNTYGNACEAACEGVEIDYDGACQASNNEIFDQYPWLLNLVDPVYCANGLTVSVYKKGNFNYIFVKYPEAPGILYFQDGTYYCENIRDFSCVDAYSLTELATQWTCNIEPPANITAKFSNLVCNNGGTFSIDITATGALSDTYGIYGNRVNGDTPQLYTFEEEETFTFTGGVGYATNNLYKLYIYDYYLADVGATSFEINLEECNDNEEEEESAPIFENYAWLNDIISPQNCVDGSQVIEYDLGPYAFLIIETPTGTTMYYQDGTRYCADRENFSCVETYGLTTPTNTWNCSDQPPSTNCTIVGNPLNLNWVKEIITNSGNSECDLKEIKSFNYNGDDYIYTLSYPIYPYCPTDTGGSAIYDCEGNVICFTGFAYYNECDVALWQAANEGDLIWEYTNIGEAITEKYPWLNDLVEPFNCFGATIREYDNGAYAFLTVEEGSWLRLYYEDGSLFCTDRENFSCVEAYGLEDVTAIWNCGNGNQFQKEEASKKLVAEEETIAVYPNPNNGVFTIDLTNINTKISKIEIFDIAGKQHHIPIDLNETTTALKLNAENLNNGSYLITVLTESKLHTQTIIIH